MLKINVIDNNPDFLLLTGHIQPYTGGPIRNGWMTTGEGRPQNQAFLSLKTKIYLAIRPAKSKKLSGCPVMQRHPPSSPSA
jgi:hypothetical protein